MPPARGDAIAGAVGASQAAAVKRGKAAVDQRAAAAAAENQRVQQTRHDRDAFDSFIREERRELSELNLAAAAANREAHIGRVRSKASDENDKVHRVVAQAEAEHEADAAIKEIRLYDRLNAATAQREEILSAKVATAVASSGPPKQQQRLTAKGLLGGAACLALAVCAGALAAWPSPWRAGAR